MAGLAEINILFKADLKQFSKEMQNSIRDIQKIGKQMQAAGKLMSTYLTAPIAAISGVSAKINMDFDDSMRKVMATSNATSEEFDAMRVAAEKMGAQTRYSASEAAEAMNYMALAGWKSQDIIAGLPGVLNLAAASGEDLSMVSDILTDGLTAFGKSAKDAAEFVDVLAAGASNSNTTIGMLGEAFQYAAPLAGSLGYEVGDITKAIGLMSNAGVKGQKAGTALRSIMTRLVKPTRESKKAMDELGISVVNADGSMKPLNDVMLLLREKFSTLTQVQKGQYAGMLAGQEALSGFLALVGAGQEDFDKLSKSIEKSTGTAARMSQQMEGGIGGSWRSLKSAVEGVLIQFGQVMAPALMKAANAMKEVALWFTGLSDGTKKLIVVISTAVAAIGPLLVGLGAVLKLAPLVATAFMAVKSAVVAMSAAMVANPIGVLLVALGSLASVLLLNELRARALISTTSNLKDINKEVSRATSKQVVELEKLLKVAKDVNESDENRVSAMKKINDISPEYLSNINKETINTNAATVAINEYVLALKNKARSEAIAGKTTELYSKLVELESTPVQDVFDVQNKLIFKSRNEMEAYIKTLGKNNAAANLLRTKYNGLFDARDKEIAKIKEQISIMDQLDDANKKDASLIGKRVDSGLVIEDGNSWGIIEEYNQWLEVQEKKSEVVSSFGDDVKGVDFKKGSSDFYDAQIKKLEELRDRTSTTAEEYWLLSQKIEEVQSKLDALKGGREKQVSLSMNIEPIKEGTLESYDRQINALKELQKGFPVASMAWQALNNEIKDIEFKIKAEIDEGSFSLATDGIARLTQEIEVAKASSSAVMAEKQEEAKVYADAVGGAFETLGSGFVASMGEAGNAFEQFGIDMANIVIKIMAMGLAQSMSNSVVIGTETAKGFGPLAAFALPALLAAAASAVTGAYANVPKFADGGVVYGPTLGLMGEYAGAANNPEVIAPLNKLKDLIEPAGSGVTQIVLGGGFKITGSELQLVLDRNTTRSKRLK